MIILLVTMITYLLRQSSNEAGTSSKPVGDIRPTSPLRTLPLLVLEPMLKKI